MTFAFAPARTLARLVFSRRTTAPALALCATLGAGMLTLPPTPAAAGEKVQGSQVTILGRTWIVSPVGDGTGRYRAERLNRKLEAFRPPAMISARQAARAYKAATGCTVRRDSMLRTISGVYYADLVCRSR
ncbi:hypothetical protein JL2886_03841 [Phaeobacter gallaeciensis]|uniref:Uncharacterized protein n=1 Tax=Phaeobacter gallaeciensis TaxID=60890 RepID=A0A1B0ZXA5_9RHOB|nr:MULTISPECIES: hypothetical protein [Phaeobacter]MEE2634749.1 hypothetical protein [Pseudomonadota bacterium]ANP38710.1 hypothetical protein JL2886_03841 [Phaeobacter gallaeciensis]MDE4061757.1 hypothetical protein [Phaeobacter gallaeciensis]MDE4124777.1 hypothetical protein [Phaeobacter gallaeciensis]MDE4129296.1 hypothetical protein [Phaeobacter gallaeciensis]